MSGLLILYSTTDGHTKRIAQFLYDLLAEKNQPIKLLNIECSESVEFESFDKVVIAASIRYGKFNRQLRRFVACHTESLNSRKTAFISVSLVARKPEKNTPETNVYTRKFLHHIRWKPDLVYVAAGMLDYSKYNFFDRNIIRFIMKITGGPTDLSSTTEFTDWEMIKEIGNKMNRL